MKQPMYALFDSKAKAWLPPFLGNSDEDAKLSFTVLCRDADHPVGRHPADYTLFRVGDWCTEEGTLEKQEPRLNLGNGVYFARWELGPSMFDERKTQ